MGTRESLNGRKNVARRKVKNGEKSPWGQCLTIPVPNGCRRSGFSLVQEKHKFSGINQKPERRRPFGTGLVRLLAVLYFSSFHIYFSARLDFPSLPISAPGSPRMEKGMKFSFVLTAIIRYFKLSSKQIMSILRKFVSSSSHLILKLD